MNLADFLRHVTKHNCEQKPLEGINITGIAVIIFNKDLKRTYRLQIYKGGLLTDTTIITACDRLGIPYPKFIIEKYSPGEK